jgi:hypothetical protein
MCGTRSTSLGKLTVSRTARDIARDHGERRENVMCFTSTIANEWNLQLVTHAITHLGSKTART